MADQIPDSAKLLQCPNPWCPSHDEGEAPNDEDVWQLPALTPRYRVQCSYCPVEGPAADTEAEAIAAWNTRAAPPAMDREAVEAAARAMCEADGIDPDEHIIGGQATGFEDFGPLWQAEDRSEGQLGLTNYASLARAALSTLSADAIRQGEGALKAREEGYRAGYLHALGLARAGVPTKDFERDVGAYMADFVGGRP